MKSRLPPVIAPPAACGIIIAMMLKQTRGLITVIDLLVLLAKCENFGFDRSVFTKGLVGPPPGVDLSVSTRGVGSSKGLESSAPEAPLPSRNDNAVSFPRSFDRSLSNLSVSTAAQYHIKVRISNRMRMVMATDRDAERKGCDARALAS